MGFTSVTNAHVAEALSVSVQPLFQSVNQLVSGFSRVRAEVKNLKELRSAETEDRFMQVMEVTGFIPGVTY